jgi:elongation of very long chain fatty acids protein 4
MARLDHAAAVVGLYLAFVVIGSLLMKMIFGSESPKDSRRGLLATFLFEPIYLLQAIYNPLQVILCGYMIKLAIEEYIRQGYQFIGNPFNTQAAGMASVVYIFYLSKIFDFADTVFIVLRRKWDQLSFLHVYHHCTIFMFYWLNINAGYDGDVYYTVVLNSFVHLIMYFYYFLRTFKITVPIVLKKMVTHLQMFQFVTMMAQAIYILATHAPYPNRITWTYFIYIATLYVLFDSFRRASYSSKKALKTPAKKAN